MLSLLLAQVTPEHIIWIILLVGLFAGLVIGGFWVIARANMGRVVTLVFGGIILVVIVFALIYLARGWDSPGIPVVR